MNKIDMYSKHMGAESSISEAVDRKLNTFGSLGYTPPEAPTQTFEYEDIEKGGEFMANAAMPILFQEERNLIREHIGKFVDELRNDDEGPLRVSDDFSFNIPEDVVDKLLEAYLEDAVDGDQEQEDDAGAEDIFGGDFASILEEFESEDEDILDGDTGQSS